MIPPRTAPILPTQGAGSLGELESDDDQGGFAEKKWAAQEAGEKSDCSPHMPVSPVIALHWGGRVPVSWLLERCLGMAGEAGREQS